MSVPSDPGTADRSDLNDVPDEVRVPLDRSRIIDAAIALADDAGIEAVSMRRLGHALGVEAMSLYNHIANKEAMLDAVAERVLHRINQRLQAEPDAPGGWRHAMRGRILAARQVMLDHPWAPGLLETRTTMNAALLEYFHGLLEIMRAGGLSYDLAHHGMHALGSRALGFTMELFEPAAGSADEELNQELLAQMASRLPLLVEMLTVIAAHDAGPSLGWCDDQAEFEFGLDLILDGLDRLSRAGRWSRTGSSSDR